MAVRGAVVLVAAILIGFALLYASGNDDDPVAAEASSTSAAEVTTTTTPTFVPGSEGSSASVPSSTSVPGSTSVPQSSSVPDDPSDTRPPADVTAVVLNGTTDDVVGVAGDNNDKLATAGYTTLEAGNAVADLATTTIYGSPEMQADAEAIRGILGFAGAVVEAKPSESLGDRSDEADVVVVIGDDVANG